MSFLVRAARLAPFRLTCCLVAAAASGPAQEAALGPRQLDLRGSDLRRIDLRGANLAARDLTGCNMQHALVGEAHFWRTRLDGVDLRGVTGLTETQLVAALWSEERPPRLDDRFDLVRRRWDERRADHVDLRGANWWGRDLSGFNFVASDLGGAVLIGADLRGASLQRARLHGALLVGADISGADLRGAEGLTAGQIVSARWTDTPPRLDDGLDLMLRLRRSGRLARRDIDGARLWLADLSGADLTGAGLSRVALMGANLRGVSLREARLAGAVLTGADLTGADLRGVTGVTPAMLISARWDAGRPPSLDADLNLQRALIDKRQLHDLDLSGANLWGRDLSGANFGRAVLRDCTLNAANLRGASFVEADLTGADLTGADVSGADLRNATGLSPGQVMSARWDAGDPPRLARPLEVVRRKFEKRDFRGDPVGGACLWYVDLAGGKFTGAQLKDVKFVGANLRDVSFLRAELQGVAFLGADLSGADLRGVRFVTPQALIAAVWDPDKPPVLDRDLNLVREGIENRRIEFGLAGAALNGPDPAGTMGPVRPDDRLASWRRGAPPRLGMPRLIGLLREQDYTRLRITE